MASELIKHVSDASFEADVLQPGTPVLVDYWAEWCGPCKMIAPILDEVAGAYQGRFIFVDREGVKFGKSLTGSRFFAMARTGDGRLAIPGAIQRDETGRPIAIAAPPPETK